MKFKTTIFVYCKCSNYFMTFREAQVTDIAQMQIVRNSVKENMLSNPALIRDNDYEDFLLSRGKGWVCEVDKYVVGFSIVDLKENNIWALFVQPDYALKGIGKKLYDRMMDWYFDQTKEGVWLSTAPGTRAEKFYQFRGWKDVGKHGEKEIKFELNYETYKAYLKR